MLLAISVPFFIPELGKEKFLYLGYMTCILVGFYWVFFLTCMWISVQFLREMKKKQNYEFSRHTKRIIPITIFYGTIIFTLFCCFTVFWPIICFSFYNRTYNDTWIAKFIDNTNKSAE